MPRDSANLLRWKNGKTRKRRAVLPIQDVDNVAVADQVPADDAGVPIYSKFSLVVTELNKN